MFQNKQIIFGSLLAGALLVTSVCSTDWLTRQEKSVNAAPADACRDACFQFPSFHMR